MGGIEIGGLARVGDQSGENACGETEGEGSESGLSGIHVPLLRRPERARVAVSQRESVGEGLEEGAEEAARHDRSSAMFPADSATDRAAEPAPERLEELLRLRLSHRGLRRDQLVRSRPSRAASETAQPAALPSAGRSQLLRADQALWPGPSLRTGDRATACASLRRQVFRRAGCREICSSGSTRGEWVGRKSRPLSYSTDFARNFFSDRPQNVAIGFSGEPVPPPTARGAAVIRNSQRCCLLAISLSDSRSQLSKIGIPMAISTS